MNKYTCVVQYDKRDNPDLEDLFVDKLIFDEAKIWAEEKFSEFGTRIEHIRIYERHDDPREENRMVFSIDWVKNARVDGALVPIWSKVHFRFDEGLLAVEQLCEECGGTGKETAGPDRIITAIVGLEGFTDRKICNSCWGKGCWRMIMPLENSKIEHSKCSRFMEEWNRENPAPMVFLGEGEDPDDDVSCFDCRHHRGPYDGGDDCFCHVGEDYHDVCCDAQRSAGTQAKDPRECPRFCRPANHFLAI